jgi:AmmeMemoRadiSam system protein A
MKFSTTEKRLLFRIARQRIVDAVTGDRSKELASLPSIPALHIKCGVFVSVYVDGQLRGCLGTFSEEEPLCENVQRMAAAAATEDTRFRPLQPDELDNLRIEISVLTPRKKISDIHEIELGKHGIYIKKGLNRGTFLPQVAVAQNWDVYEFLGNCSRYKAGIGWDGWKTAEIYVYEAIVFDSDTTDS